jgi:hypothetical protein
MVHWSAGEIKALGATWTVVTRFVGLSPAPIGHLLGQGGGDPAVPCPPMCCPATACLSEGDTPLTSEAYS